MSWKDEVERMVAQISKGPPREALLEAVDEYVQLLESAAGQLRVRVVEDVVRVQRGESMLFKLELFGPVPALITIERGRDKGKSEVPSVDHLLHHLLNELRTHGAIRRELQRLLHEEA